MESMQSMALGDVPWSRTDGRTGGGSGDAAPQRVGMTAHWYPLFADVVRDCRVGLCDIRYHDAPTRMGLTIANF